MSVRDDSEGSNGNLERGTSVDDRCLSVSIGTGDGRVLTRWSTASEYLLSVEVGDQVRRDQVLPMIRACGFIARNLMGDSTKGTNT